MSDVNISNSKNLVISQNTSSDRRSNDHPDKLLPLSTLRLTGNVSRAANAQRISSVFASWFSNAAQAHAI